MVAELIGKIRNTLCGRTNKTEAAARRRALDKMVREMPEGTFENGESIWDFTYNADAGMFFRGDKNDWVFECQGYRVELSPDNIDMLGGVEGIRVDYYKNSELYLRSWLYGDRYRSNNIEAVKAYVVRELRRTKDPRVI